MREVTRIPVCRECLSEPQPLEAEFFCSSCRTPFSNDYPLDSEGRCGLCRGGLRGFQAAYCYGSYEGVLRDLIHLYKYGRVKTLSRPLGKLLAAALPRDEKFDAIVPVPLHWARQWRRGFNQADLLARELSRLTGIPVIRPLRRVRPTAVQAGLSNTARRKNVTAAFRCGRTLTQSGNGPVRRILLIDDVMTTGSTGTACAQALKRAGAQRVAFLTVARVDRRVGVVNAAAAAQSMAGGMVG